MTKQLQDTELDRRIEMLFAIGEGPPCPLGTEFLRAFAEARPMDFVFLEPQDLADRQNLAFAGIPEWEVFASHYTTCERCKGLSSTI